MSTPPAPMNTQSAAARTGPPMYDDRGYRHRWLVLVVVMVADVMDLLDATVTNLAGPSIRRDIGGSESTLQWILAAYTLTFAVGLVTSARVGDLVGRRRMFLIGMVGFTVASLLSGLAPSPGALVAARAVQGLFAATMIPQGLAMVKASFAESELQKAFIPFGPVMGLSAVLGPILAGFLIDADVLGAGWRMIFWINVPIGAAAAYVAARYLPRHLERDRAARLDPLGALLLTCASALLIYPLVQGHEEGWPGWMFAMMAAAAAVFAGFVRRERTSRHPVIEPSLFSHRGFVAGLGFLGTFFTAMIGFSLAINLFMQYALGFTALHTGLAMTPWALGMAIGAGLSGAALGPRLGRRVVHGGLVLTVAGLLVMWWAIGHDGLDTDAWALAPGFFLCGLGGGAVFAPLFDIILAALGDHEVGTGSGLLNAVQQFCGALGVAVLGTLFFHWVPGHGFVDAIRWLLLVVAGCYAVSFAVVFLLPKAARQESGH